MTEERSNRFNVQLDDEHAAKLHAVADRVYVQPGTIARSLLSTALDLADPDAATITEILDSIPGALERAQEGLAAARAGRFVALEEL
jgi:predicted transcriptional regulator